jgi:hypothetical protein
MTEIKDLLAVLDPIRLDQTLTAIERITHSVERLTGFVVEGVDEAGEHIVRETREVKRTVERAMDDIDRIYERFHRENIFRINLGGEEWEKSLDRVERKYKQVFEEINRHMIQARGATGAAGDFMGLSGSRGAFNTVHTGFRGLMSQMPMGGLLGLVLYGMKREQAWAAEGHAVARMFSSVGEVGRRTSKDMANLVAQLESTAWDGESIAAIANAFSQFGVSAEQALTKSSLSAKFFGDNVFRVSYAFDTMTKAAHGTTGGAIAQAVQATGLEISDVATQVFRLGATLRETGANYQQFVAGILQAQSALRVQRQGIEDLTESYVRLREGLAQSQFGGSFASLSKSQRQAVSGFTLAGMQGAAQGAGGMPEGLAGFVAQRIAGRSGQSFGAVDAIVALQEGRVGQQNAQFGQVVRELGLIAKEIGGSREEQIFSLMKINPSLGFEGARAVVDINKQIEKDLDAGLTIDEAMRSAQEELNKAFKTRDQEQSEWERVTRKILFEMARLGGHLLIVIVNGLSMVVDAIMAVPAALASVMGKEGPDWSKDAVKRLTGREGMRRADVIDDAFSEMGSSLTNIGKVIGGQFDYATNKGKIGPRERRAIKESQPVDNDVDFWAMKDELEKMTPEQARGKRGQAIRKVMRARQQGVVIELTAKLIEEQPDNTLAPVGPVTIR